MVTYKKFKLRKYKTYGDYAIHRVDKHGSRHELWLLTMPIFGWIGSILYFGFILPLLYWSDYKVVYKKQKKGS